MGRWLIRILGALVVLVVLLLGMVALMPAERIARIAAERFEAATGRALVIEGKVSPRFWPVLGVETGRVSIANAAWATDEAPLFTADGLLVEINTAALWGGTLEILGIEAERPVINLERDARGRGNWQLGTGGEADAPPMPQDGASTVLQGTIKTFSLARADVSGGTIRWHDAKSGQRLGLDGVNLSLAIPDPQGRFTVSGEGLIDGRKLVLDASGGVFQAFVEGRMVPVKLAARLGGSRLDFDGRGGFSPLQAEGTLALDLADLPALGALSGSALSKPPQGFGREVLMASGQFGLDASGRAWLRGAKLVADGNVLQGDLDLVPGKDRPKLSAQLRADALALQGVSGAGSEAGAVGQGARGGMQADGWPQDRIDVSALGMVDAEVALVASSIDLGAVKFGQTRALMTLDRARAVFDLRQLAAYGGQVTGEFVVNGRGGLSVGGSLTLANLQAQALLMDLAGWDRLLAKGNLNLKFLGVGNTVDAIMKSLSGEGRVTLGQGELRGLDLLGMLRNLDVNHVGEGQKTIFDGVAGSFSIKDGVLSNSDLKLMAPWLTATGAGTLDLGRRRQDYRLRPTALSAEDGTGGIMVPLRITGTWADPTYRLDLESIARERMEEEAKALEARLREEAREAEKRAKAQLEQRLREELGAGQVEGEAVEDAVRRRAEEALGGEAGRLLEGLLGGRN